MKELMKKKKWMTYVKDVQDTTTVVTFCGKDKNVLIITQACSVSHLIANAKWIVKWALGWLVPKFIRNMLGVGSGIFSDPVYQDVLHKDPNGIYAALKTAQRRGQEGGE